MNNLDAYIEDKERLNKADSVVRENIMDKLATLNHSKKVITDTDSIDVAKLLHDEGLNEETGLPNYVVAPVGSKAISLCVSGKCEGNFVEKGLLKFQKENGKHFEIKTQWNVVRVKTIKTTRIIPVFVSIFIFILMLTIDIITDNIGHNIMLLVFCGVIGTAVLCTNKGVYSLAGKKIKLPCKITIPNFQFDNLEEDKEYVVVCPSGKMLQENPIVLQVIEIGGERFFIKPKSKITATV